MSGAFRAQVGRQPPLTFPSREDRHSPLRPTVGANRPFPPSSHPAVAADASQSTPPAQYTQYHTIHNSPPLAPMVGTDEPLRSFRHSANRYGLKERPPAHGESRPGDCCRCSVPCARLQTPCRLCKRRRHLGSLFTHSSLHSFGYNHLHSPRHRHHRPLPKSGMPNGMSV